MKTPAVPLLALIVALSGCFQAEPSVSAHTRDELLAKYQSDSVTVVRYGGPPNGPYREEGGFAGILNQPANFSWSENGKDIVVSAPAAIGYYYQLSRYRTPTNELFWILIKLKNEN